MPEIYSRYTITLDDDPLVHKYIGKATNMSSLPFTDPEKLVEKANSYTPTAVFVDVNLDSDVSGIDYISALREQWPFVPIIVITSDPNPTLIGKALGKGANDFIRKPIVREELTARLEVRLNEAREKQGADEYEIGGLTFNRRLGTIAYQGKISHLPPLESELFMYLINNIGLVTTKDAIKHHLWGGTAVSVNSLDKKISNLRKAISDLEGPIEIQTQYGGKIRLGVDEAEGNLKVKTN